MLGRSGRLRARLGLLGGVKHGETPVRDDGVLVQFYRHEPRRLFLSIFCHFVAWLIGVFETYLIMAFMGIGVPLATATLIESFGTAIRSRRS